MVTSRLADEHGELEHVEIDGDEIVLGGDDFGRLQVFELTDEMALEIERLLEERARQA